MPKEAQLSTDTIQRHDRYPGASPFADDPIDRRLFFGRRVEIDNLVQELGATRLLVLYGKSGLGKTSLLQAGVFPELRERDLLPLRVRVNRTDIEPVEMLIKQIELICAEQGIDYTPGVRTSLWEFFKTAVFWRGKRLLIPVLVLDQFEEIFTIQGAEGRGVLAQELGQLLSGGLPRSIRERVRAGESLAYSEQPPAMKMIISLRWEYVGRLEELFAEIPSILSHRFLLRPLYRDQARSAVVEPAAFEDARLGTRPFTYTETTLNRLLDFLAGADGAIEPFELQLLCHHVELQVAKHQQTGEQIVVDEHYLRNKAQMMKVLEGFYLSTLARLPGRTTRREARRLCEDLCPEGHREPLGESKILRDYRLDKPDLERLVESRLLRREPQLGGFTYELTHDSLVHPVLAHRRYRLPKPVLYIGLGMLLTLVALATIAVLQTRYAERAEIVAVEAQYQETTRRDVASEEVRSLLEGNQRLEADLQQAREEIERLVDKNTQIAQALEEARKVSDLAAIQVQTQQLRAESETLKKAVRPLPSASTRKGGIREPDMIKLRPGAFVMGSSGRDPQAQPDEFPQHKVSIQKPFAIGRYEVTFEEYDTFALATGSRLPSDSGWGRGNRPVIDVSWMDAVAYARWLSKQTGKRYRLPSEAEWEYAARAGAGSRYWWGGELLDGLANCIGCGSRWDGKQTAPVGSFKPNPFRVHDTAGNVWEWVQDCYHESYRGAPDDGSAWGAADCGRGVFRGGGWYDKPSYQRSASRFRAGPDHRSASIGFRLALDLE